MWDKFAKFNHIFVECGKVKNSPFYIDPKSIESFIDGELYGHDSKSIKVTESAEEIHRIIIQKLDENKKNEVIG